MGRFRFVAIDALWLLALATFILSGMMMATFHGDEAMHIYMSRDYVTAFIDHHPEQLTAGPPYFTDEDNTLRILNGTITRYAIGLTWQLAGLNSGMLPPRPGWDWGLSYDRDVETGHRPADALLAAGRLESSLFLIVSVWVMFGVGWQFGGRIPAYFMSGLYVVNPIILLNGRRAMLESPLLCFGLLTLWMAILIARGRGRWYGWVALTLFGGLSIASKHSGIVFVGAALGWIGLTEVIGWTRRKFSAVDQAKAVPILFTLAKLVASGVGAVILFYALSPALWSDPLARFGDLLEQRQILLDIQVNADPAAPTTIPERIQAIIAQPFMTPPMQYEVSFWAEAKTISDEVTSYMGSPLSGLQFGVLIGLPLTLLTGWGLVTAARGWKSWEFGLLVWFGITAASLMVNPLPWQRYYIPLIPLASVLVGVGLMNIIGYIRRVRVQRATVQTA